VPPRILNQPQEDSLDTAMTEVGAGENGGEQDEQNAKDASKEKDSKKVAGEDATDLGDSIPAT
jgi:hypothetical protein